MKKIRTILNFIVYYFIAINSYAKPNFLINKAYFQTFQKPFQLYFVKKTEDYSFADLNKMSFFQISHMNQIKQDDDWYLIEKIWQNRDYKYWLFLSMVSAPISLFATQLYFIFLENQLKFNQEETK